MSQTGKSLNNSVLRIIFTDEAKSLPLKMFINQHSSFKQDCSRGLDFKGGRQGGPSIRLFPACAAGRHFCDGSCSFEKKLRTQDRCCGIENKSFLQIVLITARCLENAMRRIAVHSGGTP